MRLEQLRFLCAIVDQDMNMSRAAEVMNTSQPGVSKQIKLLEAEIGTPLLNRGAHRIVGLTPAGAHVVNIARRILDDVDSIVAFGKESASGRKKRLTIATTHLHASYVFPPVFSQFRERFPDVELVLRNGEPSEIYHAVAHAKADIGVTTLTPEGDWHVLQIPAYDLGRYLVLPTGHPISKLKTITLEDIARYPLITYCLTFAGFKAIAETFDRQGLQPVVAIQTMDTESIKKYVKLGMGIAVVHSVAIDSLPDPLLQVVDVTHLFGSAKASVILRPTLRVPNHLWYFISLLAPDWDQKRIVTAIPNMQRKARKSEAID